jgi:hypothetical protein
VVRAHHLREQEGGLEIIYDQSPVSQHIVKPGAIVEIAGTADHRPAGEGLLLLWVKTAVAINEGPYMGPSLAPGVTKQAIHPFAPRILFKAVLGKEEEDEEKDRTRCLELEET